MTLSPSTGVFSFSSPYYRYFFSKLFKLRIVIRNIIFESLIFSDISSPSPY